MKKQLMPFGLLAVLAMSFTMTSSQDDDVKVPLVKFEQLAPLISKEDSKTHVVNFWATWCGPCIKEIPDFQKTYDELGGEIDFILVSLDFPSENERVIKYMNKKKITIPGYHLDETDGNVWVPKVDNMWRGHIPATLVYNNSTGYRKFHIGGLTEQELKDLINEASN